LPTENMKKRLNVTIRSLILKELLTKEDIRLKNMDFEVKYKRIENH